MVQVSKAQPAAVVVIHFVTDGCSPLFKINRPNMPPLVCVPQAVVIMILRRASRQGRSWHVLSSAHAPRCLVCMQNWTTWGESASPWPTPRPLRSERPSRSRTSMALFRRDPAETEVVSRLLASLDGLIPEIGSDAYGSVVSAAWREINAFE